MPSNRPTLEGTRHQAYYALGIWIAINGQPKKLTKPKHIEAFRRLIRQRRYHD